MKRQTAGEEEVLGWVAELRRGENVESNSRQIFFRYYGQVRRFFLRRCPTPELAEELSQETFLQVFQRIESFRGGGTFASWVFAIAANKLRNERRRRSRLKRDAREISLDSGAQHSLPWEVDEKIESPEVTTLTRERLAAAVKVIDKLPEQQGTCLRLLLKGYNYAQIGEILKLSPSTVRVHVHAARKRLRDELGEELGDPSD